MRGQPNPLHFREEQTLVGSGCGNKEAYFGCVAAGSQEWGLG